MATEAQIFAAHQRLKKNPHRPHSYVLSGIRGDVNHSFGYHLPPNRLPKSDYSLQKKRDRRGAKMYPSQASAWDLTFNSRDMKVVTNRLLKAAKKRDPRIVMAVSEFCGTRDGSNTYPYDVSGNYCEGVNSWDDSHLWHVHISFLRDATAAQVAAVVDVICGVPAKAAPKPTPTKNPVKPKPAARVKPFPLAAGHYFGDINGPEKSHGGFYASERGNIRQIEIKVGVPHPNGRYDQTTVRYVKVWQKKHKIEPSGKVGTKTWKAMAFK